MKSVNVNQVELVNQILYRATEDKEFKQELIHDPKSVVEKFYGYNVKDDVKLVVEDQSNSDIIYLNIPRNPQFENLELTEEELEKISGGSAWACLGIGIAACAVYDFVDGFIEGFSK